MTNPLEMAVDIGRIVLEAQASSLPLDLRTSADSLLSRFPGSGFSRSQILDVLEEEAGDLGLALN